VLGLSTGAAVSLQLRGLRRAVETDRHLQRQLATRRPFTQGFAPAGLLSRLIPAGADMRRVHVCATPKKRKHFLTIGYTDKDNKPQGVVLELAKGRAKPMITIIEARSGKKAEYESEEAKQHVQG